MDDALDKSNLSDAEKEAFLEELMLIEDMYPNMDKDLYNSGKVTPVFFGSALNNFGLDVFLNYFHQLAPPPQGYEHSEGNERDLGDSFSGFIFKMQANMNQVIAIVRHLFELLRGNSSADNKWWFRIPVRN